MATEEGLLNYYKEKNIKPWIIGKKQINKNLESNRIIVEKIDEQLKAIIKSLQTAMISEDNW